MSKPYIEMTDKEQEIYRTQRLINSRGEPQEKSTKDLQPQEVK